MRPYLDELLRRTGDTNERLVSIVRVAFTTVVLARLVSIGVFGVATHFHLRLALELPAFALAVATSGWMLLALRRRSLTPGERLFSVVADAAVCFALLLVNVLMPWPGYEGVLRTPDAATLVVTTVAAGFRISRPLAMLGAALNAASATVLWLFDVQRNSAVLYEAYGTLAFMLILVAACGAMAMLVADRITRLVATAADQAAARVRTADRLDVLLKTQHDLRNLLASATLNAGLLRESLDGAPSEPGAIARELEQDLGHLADFVNEKNREVTRERAPEPVTLAELGALVTDAARHVHGLAVVANVPAEPIAFIAAGGRKAVSRALVNLLVNAHQGDGQRGAHRCEVRAAVRERHIVVDVEDDGPGFAAQLLAAVPAPGLTTKAEGSGLGLAFVQAMLTESGGGIERTNLAAGARVRLTFPMRSST